MDLKKLDELVAADEEGAVVIIYQRNGDPYLAADGSESTMTVLGSESKKYKAAKRNTTKRMLNRRRTMLEPEDIERNRINQAVAGVVDWHGWDDGKKDLACTPEDVAKVLKHDHILEQVEAAIMGHADFFTQNSAA